MDIRMAAGAAALMLAALVPGQAEARQAIDCEEESWGEHFIEVENVAPRAGAALRVTPRRIDGPFGVKDVEQSCVRDWRVRPGGVARLSSDQTRLILADDVEPGTRITVEARVGDTLTRGVVTVVARADASILGQWRRNCPAPEGAAPIQRLTIYADNYLMFDSEGRQWSGPYTFDPATGAVAFGPYVLPAPQAARLEGVAVTEGDQLTLDGVFFADTWGRPAGEDCPMVFTRVP